MPRKKLSQAVSHWTVTISPKEQSRAEVADVIDEAIVSGYLPPGKAAKVRGKSGWVGSNSFGKLGRLGLAVLKEIQYGPEARLDEVQKGKLDFHKRVVQEMPPRVVRVSGEQRARGILYTDAEYEPGAGRPPRLGWVFFPPRGTPIGQTLLLDSLFVDTWLPRKQQIFAAEAVATVAATYNWSDLVR